MSVSPLPSRVDSTSPLGAPRRATNMISSTIPTTAATSVTPTVETGTPEVVVGDEVEVAVDHRHERAATERDQPEDPRHAEPGQHEHLDREQRDPDHHQHDVLPAGEAGEHVTPEEDRQQHEPAERGDAETAR